MYDVVVYGEHTADVGEGGKEVEGVSVVSVTGTSESMEVGIVVK